MTKTNAIADQTVIAQDAPIGQLLWPVREAKYAPNFTLASVAVIRNEARTYVEWTYQGGNKRQFEVGEGVVCRF